MKIGIACRYTMASGPARTVNYTNSLLGILSFAKPASNINGFGKGTLKDPYRPSLVSHWFGLSQMKLKEAPIFIQVGQRLIARWGTGAVRFQNYCTDVTGAESEVQAALQKATEERTNYEKHVVMWGERYAKMDEESGISSALTAYSKKALRVAHLSDQDAAAQSRLLLGGNAHAGADCPELASSLCSLFIAEAHRVPETFVIAIMLLDLVETSTTYGKNGAKTYTWRSMLSHDTDGIPGRGKGVKVQGKHPMAAAGTVDLGHVMTIRPENNMVADHAISVMSVWLAHYLAKNNRDCSYFIIEGAKGSWTPQTISDSPEDKGNFILNQYCRKAVRARASDFAVQIGGTTVQYENIAGDRV